MHRAILLLCLFALPSVAAENLASDDYVGTWYSNWSAIEGEVNKLVVEEDLSSTFSRATDGEPESEEFLFRSPTIRFVDDIAIIEYREDGTLVYKLVLSGWKTTSTRRLFGTMYMYRNDEMFNGLPVSFETNVGGDS